MPRSGRTTRRKAGAWRELRRELHGDSLGDEALLEGLGHQALDGLAPALAVAERQVVHVHADELVGLFLVEAAPELLRVVDRVFPVRQRVGDAVVEGLRYFPDHPGTEVATDDVAAERQRQAAGPFRPPLAQV